MAAHCPEGHASESNDSCDTCGTPITTPAAPATHTGGDEPTNQPPAVVADTGQSAFEWVAEVWIDPDWYRLQQSPDPIPSPGLPKVFPLRGRSILIGRTSRGRDIHPDIDCEPDSGISRRQSQLTSDGNRWFVEDLESANGTYVADSAGVLPENPIPSGRRHELHINDRIYVGAWTRIVLRHATAEEHDTFE